MTREEYIKRKVIEKGTNLKAIAAEINVPYSTLRDMQVNVGSARVDNVIKLCKYLGISVDELNSVEKTDIIISEFEKSIIIAYRNTTDDMRNAVNKLLGIETELRISRIAAYGGGTTEKQIPDVLTGKQIPDITPEELEALEDEDEADEIEKKLKK